MDEIMVSIACTTYNHENYIREALDSFLVQKTKFSYEILIHDDASTDNTAEIIREYEKKYPDVIKPIYQLENQYSKGVRVDYLNQKRANGKYLALCEGDDYWTDVYKLQKQVDYMEKNTDCTFTFHNAYIIRNNEKRRLVIPWRPENRKYFSIKNRRYSSGELQLLGFIPTASYMFPKYLLDNPPKWFFEAPVGDNPIKLIATSFGYAHFIDEPMCIYRFNVPNSATTKWKSSNINQTVLRCNEFIKMLDDFNEYSDFKYNKDIEISKLTWELQKLSLLNDKNVLKDKKFEKYLNLLKGPYKVRYYLLIYFPSVYKILKRLKNGFS